MNCRSGDMAVIIDCLNSAENIGKFVDVLESAPSGKFHLPDGGYVGPAPSNGGTAWVVRSAGGPLVAYSGHQTRYGVYYDFRLRPIRGEPERVSTDEPATAEA